MRKLKLNQVLSLMFILALTLLGTPNIANAQMSVSQAKAAVNKSESAILDQINAEMKGQSFRISKRKKLVIKQATKFELSGNLVYLTFDVKLKRKLRRDAHGYIIVKGTYGFNFSGTSPQVCLSNPSVTKVKLSNTLRLGEAFYRKFAGGALPKNTCFDF